MHELVLYQKDVLALLFVYAVYDISRCFGCGENCESLSDVFVPLHSRLRLREMITGGSIRTARQPDCISSIRATRQLDSISSLVQMTVTGTINNNNVMIHFGTHMCQKSPHLVAREAMVAP